jgi:hypothetical protein
LYFFDKHGPSPFLLHECDLIERTRFSDLCFLVHHLLSKPSADPVQNIGKICFRLALKASSL